MPLWKQMADKCFVKKLSYIKLCQNIWGVWILDNSSLLTFQFYVYKQPMQILFLSHQVNTAHKACSYQRPVTDHSLIGSSHDHVNLLSTVISDFVVKRIKNVLAWTVLQCICPFKLFLIRFQLACLTYKTFSVSTPTYLPWTTTISLHSDVQTVIFEYGLFGWAKISSCPGLASILWCCLSEIEWLSMFSDALTLFPLSRNAPNLIFLIGFQKTEQCQLVMHFPMLIF